MSLESTDSSACPPRPVPRLDRQGQPFQYAVSCATDTYAHIAGVRHHLLFQDFDAMVSAYRQGQPRARELFGSRVHYAGPGWLGISYGHINTLGSPLIFPPDSEVGQRPIYGSLAQGITALERGLDDDFTAKGLFPFYLKLREKLKNEFPDAAIGLGGFKAEGPLTTAWLLRGQDFFLDIYDDPAAARHYLELVADSVIRYIQTCARIEGGLEEMQQQGVGLVDDGAAFLAPDLWPELVLPLMEHYYRRLTQGIRSAHIENLTQGHLHYLDNLSLSWFDPSVSPRLTPALLRDRCSVLVQWRLNEMELVNSSLPQVQRFVIEAAADGATQLWTHITPQACDAMGIAKVQAFLQTGEQVAAALAGGCSREELRRLA